MGEEDERISAWEEIAEHPFFKSCFEEDRPLLEAMIDKLDRHARIEAGLATSGMVATFELHRDNDVSGVSGTGVVADGAVFPDGVTVVRWRGERRSTVVWQDLEDVEAIHGHGGATRIVWTMEMES